MNTNIRLSEYSANPLYNIKAVVQATGISPSTLRAWERRYGICQPIRSESGYRLYSDRDVAIIRWLKTQVDAGMAISQAAAWLEALSQDGMRAEPGLLPINGAVAAEMRSAQPYARDEVRSLEVLQIELTAALVRFQEAAADQIMAEAFALYPIEQVGEELVTPVLIEIGERWHRNQISITREHFASNYLLHRLTALLRTVPNLDGHASLWIGCAPGELHEGGAVLLALYMRRAGYPIHYLGQNLPVDDIVAEVRRQRPAMVLFSASTQDSVTGLREMVKSLNAIDSPRPIVGYGGRMFINSPQLRTAIDGVYLGDSAQAAVDAVGALLSEGYVRPSRANMSNGSV